MKKALSLILALVLCFSMIACSESGAHEHEWNKATCTDPKTCDICGETKGEATGHDWEDATCTDPKTCDNCGKTKGKPNGHSWIDSTSDSPRFCSVCGVVEGAESESTGPYYPTEIYPTEISPTVSPEPDDFSGVTVSIVSIAEESHDNLWFYQQIEEKFGCNIEVIEISPYILSDKLCDMLASGTLPTIFESFVPIQQIVEYGEQGAFVDVMDPENLEKMPNFAKIFADDPEINAVYMQTAAEDGSHYILPTYDSEREVNHYWIYNETAFEEAGVEWAGDPKGFLDMLRALKKHFPGSYPLTGGAWQGTLDRMIYTWGVNSSYAAYDWDKGEWFYGAVTDEYFNMMSMLLTAYNEGLMNPEMLTQGNAAIQDDMTNHNSFVYNSWLDWMVMHNQAFVDENMVDHEIPAPTPVGPTGKTLELAKYTNTSGTVINARNPAAAECAMAIMDWMYDISEGGGAWLATVGDPSFLQTNDDGRFAWIDGWTPQGNTDINYAFAQYGMFQTSLTVRYAPESPYFSFVPEVQMAQDIGEKIGYVKCPPPVNIADIEIADAYTTSQMEIKNMQRNFILENWNRAKFNAWCAEFMDNYGFIMDYLNDYY